jgi:hypothetical protein
MIWRQLEGHRQLAEVVWRYGHGWIGRAALQHHLFDFDHTAPVAGR